MTNRIELSSQVYIPELHDPHFQIRRKLFAELAEIGDLLSKSPLQDELTEKLRHWHSHFFNSLHPELIETQFLDLLEGYLTEALTGEPLDEQTVLGSDGIAYGFMFLKIYQHQGASPYKERAPLSPLNDEVFTTCPHTVARHLVTWLKKKRPHFHPTKTEEEFRKLPPQVDSRIAQLVARRKEREQSRSQMRLNMQSVSLMASHSFETTLEKVGELKKQNHQNLAYLEQKDSAIKKTLEHLISDLTVGIKDLEKDIENLRDQQSRIDSQVHHLQMRDMQLKISILEVKAEIKKRDKRRMEACGLALAIVLGAGVGSFISEAVLTSLESKVAMAVLPKMNSAMLSFSVAI